MFLLPTGAALVMYALVHVQTRYVAAFVTVGLVALFAALATMPGRARHAVVALGSAAAVCVIASQAAQMLHPQTNIAPASKDAHQRVAECLRAMGAARGDEVAYVGDPFGPLHAYWARLAGVRITANVAEAEAFWGASKAVRSRVLAKLAGTGTKLVVSDRAPPAEARGAWRRLPRTGQYALVLEPVEVSSAIE